MSSHTSRMVALLGAFRRERNGLVADTMHYDGTRYGLNYGVSLVTVRQKVRALEPVRDEEFARFLMTQQVRCLQLAALHLADPAAWQTMDDARRWLDALNNSELAEEAAYALLSHATDFAALFEQSIDHPALYARYALLRAAARRSDVDWLWLDRALKEACHAEHRLLTQAAVALWAHYANSGPSQKEAVLDRLSSLGTTPTELYLKEELAWQIL